jgi:hypothetical protein
MRRAQIVTGSQTIDMSAAVPTSIPNSCAFYIRSAAQAWAQQRDLCRLALDIRGSALAVAIGDWALAARLSRCMQLGTRRGHVQLATGSLSRCICCFEFAVGIGSFTRVDWHLQSASAACHLEFGVGRSVSIWQGPSAACHVELGSWHPQLVTCIRDRQLVT